MAPEDSHERSIMEVLRKIEDELMDHRYLAKEVVIRVSMSDGRAIGIFVSGIGFAMMALGFSLIAVLPDSAPSYVFEGIGLFVGGCVFYLIIGRIERWRIKGLWGTRRHP